MTDSSVKALPKDRVRGDYPFTRGGLAAALAQAGVRPGDSLFVHADLSALGKPVDGADAGEVALAALTDAVGPEGTLLVPTYTFSFCRGEIYDPADTPTPGGPWSPSASFLEAFRTLPGTRRSIDPIHSVAARGRKAAALLEGISPTCFGRGSVFDRLLKDGGRIAMIGLDLEEATLRHHTEEEVGVPFRFRKLFTGRLRENGRERKLGWVYNVRILAENGAPDGSRITRAAGETGRSRSARVGDGVVTVITAADLDAVTREEIGKDRWATARGPAGDPAQLERTRVGAAVAPPALSADASMHEVLEKLWWIPRNIVSEGFDVALDALATQLPMTIHEYPSGTECWSWIVPEKWTCHEAYLETLDGRRLFSTRDHPLHVVQYSLPFDGIVSRDELFGHLHVSERRPQAIPYVFKYYERNWGLCCSRATRDTLNDERYRVVIRSEFSYGTMRVGEAVIPGASEDSIVLCAHLCHPSQAMDDMSGIVVGLEVMRRLSRRRNLRHTYRYLIVPETIGSVAYLASNAALIPKMKGGLYLEMLGLDQPHAFQQTFTGDTPIDRAFARGLREADPASWTGPWRSVIGNDERQFNGPGVRVPMASLSRVRRPDDPQWPYPEYHTSDDNLSLVSDARLEESVAAVLRMIDTLEADRVPVNLYQGEVFCSRYGLHIDPYTNLEGHNALFRIMDLIDGTRSLSQIAQACGVSVSAAQGVVDELARHRLIRWQGEAEP